MAFLEKIAEKYLEEYGSDVFKIVFVFPTRRARLYFRKHLQTLKEPGSALWTPPVYSFSDFTDRLSGLTVADPLDLIFELFTLYREKMQVSDYRKEFEEFYPWGKMILSDFDEMDKYLVDTNELFRVLKAFKEVEETAGPEMSGIYGKYIGFWGSLGGMYHEFNGRLRAKKKAYEGMVYREVAENIEAIVSARESRLYWKKVVFCGFNALTKAEEVIFKYLMEAGIAETYWDVDRYFTEDENQEAGKFFRLNRKNLGLPANSDDIPWIEDRLWEPKTIEIIGAQSKVSQAKLLGNCLEKLYRKEGNPENVAVVLPDESLLFPTLNSLPKEISQVNVTIGFPLARTPVFSLFDAVMELQLRAQEVKLQSKKDEFYHKDIVRVLNHPYVKPLAPEYIDDFTTAIKKKNLIYLDQQEIETHLHVQELVDIFVLRPGALQLMDFFTAFLDAVRGHYREHEPDLFPVDYEYLYHFYTLISRLKDSLKTAERENPELEHLKTKAFHQLLTDIMQNTRIPFTGEPLVGLQIMGMLETQTLDFDHLYVLSVNEGHLPPGKVQQSLIPFETRKATHMPTYEDGDAIAAYHFYRLLKNSKNVTLFYVTEVKGLEKNEKSRFIEQIAFEFPDKNRNADVRQRVEDFAFEIGGGRPISIKKSKEIIRKLATLKYSASSLLTYLTCPLKFYLSKVLEIEEDEEVYESADYRLLGTIMHHALEQLYKPFAKSGKTVSDGDIEALSNGFETILTESYKKNLEAVDLTVGRNRLVYEVMLRYLRSFFIKEKERPDFSVQMLEGKVKGIPFDFTLGDGNGGKKVTVQIKGVIDRLDHTEDGVYTVIDYKTGGIKSMDFKGEEDFGKKMTGQEAVNRKAMFQLFFYRYLLKRQGEYKGKYRLGIYSFKDIKDGIKYVKAGGGEIVDDRYVDQYVEILKGIFREIFDEGLPFDQTKDEKNCAFCPFTHICSREPATYF